MLDETEYYLKAELDRRIREDPEMWDFIQQSSLDGVWFWDLENPEEEWMSPEFWELLGVDPATKSHSPSEWQDLAHPEDVKRALVNFHAHCADPNHPYDQSMRYRHADGSTVWVRCRGLAIRDETGRPIRMLGAHNEISAVKRAREESRMLAAANAELKSFAYAVSHDLKSPLNTVSMLLQEIPEARDVQLSGDARQMLSLAGSTIRRMQLLIEELLRFTTIVGDVVEFEPVSLNRTVQTVLTDLRWDIEKAGSVFELAELPEIWGDRVQLRMLFQNLILNALKFGKPGAAVRVWIDGEEEDGMVTIRVRDNGMGIRPQDHEKIFAIFGRLHRAEKIPGSGLGLSLCSRVAMNHGGDISVQSELDKGATFSVRLPVRQQQD